MENIFNNLKRFKKNSLLYGFLAVMVIGYVFFFTSNFTLSNDSQLVFTEHGVVQEWENRAVSVVRWDYSSEQSKMEVELDINNSAFDGVDRYFFTAAFRPGGRADLTPIIEDSNFIVLHIENVPRNWREISLRMWLDEEQSGEGLPLYNNVRNISQVEQVVVKTKTEYLIDRIILSISEYETSIVQMRRGIRRRRATIGNIEQSINTLKESKRFQTAREIEQTNEAINNHNQTLEELRTEISDLQENIQEYETRIIHANSRLEVLREEMP